MMEEIWKDIEGYEGLYQVSNLGRVKSLPRFRNNQFNGSEIIMKPHFINGYLNIMLVKDGIKKRFFVHRLVACAFIPNPYNLPFVNHKDENKENNCVDNLEWCTAKYNSNYGNRNKKMLESRNKNGGSWSEKCVEQYTKDGQFVKEYKSLNEASRQTGVSLIGISLVCRGKEQIDEDGYSFIRRTAGGYVWKFKEDSDYPKMTGYLDWSGTTLSDSSTDNK